MAKQTGWVPQQHGAWAMILIPAVVGADLASRTRPLQLADLTLCLTWLVGYFAFNAAVLVAKSPPKRRPQYYPALATYGVITAALGLSTLLLWGWALLWWVPCYALLLGVALWLAATKRERSLASGVLTVLASCALMAIMRLSPGAAPPSPSDWCVMASVTAYFVGTVLHVKALIRERRDPRSARRSLAYHVALALATLVAVVLGWLTWPWLVFTLALVARSWWMPRAQRSPREIGYLEMAMSVAVLALALLVP